MQDAAGNIFVDRSGIRKHSDHSVINIIFFCFLFVFPGFSRLFFDLLHTVGAS